MDCILSAAAMQGNDILHGLLNTVCRHSDGSRACEGGGVRVQGLATSMVGEAGPIYGASRRPPTRARKRRRYTVSLLRLRAALGGRLAAPDPEPQTAEIA